jgi:hypothetical protein
LLLSTHAYVHMYIHTYIHTYACRSYQQIL